MLVLHLEPKKTILYDLWQRFCKRAARSLLDADQPIPWVDQPLELHLKFRFYYQDYDKTRHTNVQRTQTWGIGAPVEYDVPKCSERVMGCSQEPSGRWIHTITGT